jgi:phosphatidylinositol glycan class U
VSLVEVPQLNEDLRHPLFTLTVYLYTLLLLPMLHSLWLLTGTGNANFFYAATMVHGLNSSLAIADVLGASIRSHIKDSVHAKMAIAPTDGKNQGPIDLEGKEWQIIQLNKVD